MSTLHCRISNSSSRSCLLLKTLLVLLCIYIKRVTATNTSWPQSVLNPYNANVEQGEYYLDEKLINDGEVSFDLVCPLDRAWRAKFPKQTLAQQDAQSSISSNKISTLNTTASSHSTSKKFELWKNKIRKEIRVHHWLKNNQTLYRENGEPYVPIEESDKDTLTLVRVGPSDEGEYTCVIQYPKLPDVAYRYFELKPSITFYLRVHDQYLPDIKPIISHPPENLYKRRGDNATFTCKSTVTMTSQTTYWFKSNCAPTNDINCLEEFFNAYNRSVDEQPHHIDKYVLVGHHTDELPLLNITDSDFGHYGCIVENKKGIDIRLGSLNLVESWKESLSETMTKPTTSPSTITSDKNTSAGSHLPSSSHIITTVPVSASTNPKQNFETQPVNQSIFSTLNTPNNLQSNISKLRESEAQVYSTSATTFPSLNVAASHQEVDYQMLKWAIIIIGCLVISVVVYLCTKGVRNSMLKHKKNGKNSILPEPVVGMGNDCKADMRRHLPNGDCPDIYNIGKGNDGFISGHFLQNNGQLMTESMCSRALEKEKNPSISSNSNSDEASSWGKSMSPTLSPLHGEHCRTLYLHTSNSTATTVPMYDHPPSTGLSRLCGAMVQDSCVINPTYGFVRPDSDATEWTLPRRNLERLNKIGQGEFGEVWRYIARQKDGTESYVAVKQIRRRAGIGDRERLDLIAEIEIMKLVNEHPNVIKILHYCDDQEPLLLIMEYAEHGKLQTYLRSCRDSRKISPCSNDFGNIITSKELVKFSYHVAKGMEYVASKGIIHRDLASRNILLSKEKICKVADFGFARRVNDDSPYERSSTVPEPVKWMAPESLTQNKYTTKSDVFSFGILMWEIVTLGAEPYGHLTSKEVLHIVKDGGRLEKPPHCKDEFHQIMARCWSQDPVDRPTFKKLADELEKLLLSENDYIELDQYPEHAYYNVVVDEEKEVVNTQSLTTGPMN